MTVGEAEQAFDALGTGYAAALAGTLDDVLDVIADRVGRRHLLDAALGNRDPQRRREIGLWLLAERVDSSIQLSDRTPINVLFDNPTLDADDIVLLRRLLATGADPGFGVLGADGGRHPVLQLCERRDDDEVILPLLDTLLESDGLDLAASVGEDGGTLIDTVRTGAFPLSRSAVLERLLEYEGGNAA